MKRKVPANYLRSEYDWTQIIAQISVNRPEDLRTPSLDFRRRHPDYRGMKAECTPRSAGPGRPRSFDRDMALTAALQLFWRQGYEATSLDDLTAAMKISRSSFYGCFGSKHGVLVAALESYAADAQARLRAVAEAGPEAVPAMLEAIANPQDGPQGCLLVNCITELAPHDPAVAELGRAHIAALENMFAAALSPEDPAAAQVPARTLVSLAIGTLTLRKAGLPPEQIRASLDLARGLFPGPG